MKWTAMADEEMSHGRGLAKTQKSPSLPATMTRGHTRSPTRRFSVPRSPVACLPWHAVFVANPFVDNIRGQPESDRDVPARRMESPSSMSSAMETFQPPAHPPEVFAAS
jgi:hypothetical protein